MQADLQGKEQQKQQSIDEMRDKKTGLERTVELKRDLQGKKQQELRNVRAELQRLEGSSSRLQELEGELAKVVSSCPSLQTAHWKITTHEFPFEAPGALTAQLYRRVFLPQERDLQRAVQSSNVEELKAEVEELQREKVELDRAQRQLDKEMETLNVHTTARTQMDMLKREKVIYMFSILPISPDLPSFFPNLSDLCWW